VFFYLDLDPDLEPDPDGSGSVKNESGSETLCISHADEPEKVRYYIGICQADEPIKITNLGLIHR
jgi:hypothetical protein